MATDRFGGIIINPGAPAKAPEDAKVPVSGPKAPEPASPPLIKETPPAEPKPKKVVLPQVRRRPKKFRPNKPVSAGPETPRPWRRILAWLSVIPLLVILYWAGSYFLLPLAIKSLALPRLSQFVERPIKAGRIIYSPFSLELFVDDVLVGPAPGDATGKDLLTLESAHFRFSLDRILDRKFVCRQLEVAGISVNVVRDADSRVNLDRLYDFFMTFSSGRAVKQWPSWFLLDEIKVSSANIHYDDRVAQKAFTIEQVRFHLPSAETRENEGAAAPKLSAVINASPFEINAVRFQDQSGLWRTGFNFAFRNLVLNNFKDLLPLPETGLSLAEGEADLDLAVILPEKQHGQEGLVAEGKAHLRNVLWQGTDKQSVLKVPEARVVYHILPGSKLVRFMDVDFLEPELVLSGGETPGNLPGFANFVLSVLKRISSADEVMAVENFVWNNGRIRMAGGSPSSRETEWHDVTLGISGLVTAGFRAMQPSNTDGPASFTFRASDLAAKPAGQFFSKGELSGDGLLSGMLEITGLDLDRYPSILAGSSFSLRKGRADLSFNYEFAGFALPEKGNIPAGNAIRGGAFKASGFELARNARPAMSGDALRCNPFYLDMVERTIVCEELELEKVEIFSDLIFDKEAAKGDAAANKFRFLAHNLQVSASTVHSAFKGTAPGRDAATLKLHDVNIDAKGVQSVKPVNNVTASLKAGKDGKGAIKGSYSAKTGEGTFQVDVEEIELAQLRPAFSSWFIPEVKGGVFGAQGTLQLPVREFTGKIKVNNLEAGEGNGAGISWRQAFCDECTYKSSPMSLYMDKVFVLQPVVKPGLSNGEAIIREYVRDDELLKAVRINSIRVVDGSYELDEPVAYPGYQPRVHNINGMLYQSGDEKQKFSVNGKVDGNGSFSVQGVSALFRLLSYRLEMKDFDLQPFDSALRDQAGLSGAGAVSSWTQEMEARDNSTTVATMMLIDNVKPLPGSRQAESLPLLIRENNRLEMKLAGEYSAGKPRPFLLEHFISNLRYLGAKAAISPYLVLKDELPGLKLPQGMLFAPGSSSPDEAMLSALSGYRDLLNARPYLKVRLQGQYDPDADEKALQAVLQEEADKQWQAENRRREMEKARLEQEERKRRAELGKNGTQPGVVTEEVIPGDDAEGVQPLPRVTVQVAPSQLEDLAKQRVRVVYDYLVGQLQAPPERILAEPGVTKGAPNVKMDVTPSIPTGGERQ